MFCMVLRRQKREVEKGVHFVKAKKITVLVVAPCTFQLVGFGKRVVGRLSLWGFLGSGHSCVWWFWLEG